MCVCALGGRGTCRRQACHNVYWNNTFEWFLSCAKNCEIQRLQSVAHCGSPVFTLGSWASSRTSSSPPFFFFFPFSLSKPEPDCLDRCFVLTCLLVAVRPVWKLQADSNCTDAMVCKGSMNQKSRLEKWACAQSTSDTEFQKNMFLRFVFYQSVESQMGLFSHSWSWGHAVQYVLLYIKRTWWILITFIATFSLQNTKMSSEVNLQQWFWPQWRAMAIWLIKIQTFFI